MTQTHYILKDENDKIVKMTDSFPLARQGGYEQTKTTQDIVRCSGELYLNGENPKPDILEKARILRSQRNDLYIIAFLSTKKQSKSMSWIIRSSSTGTSRLRGENPCVRVNLKLTGAKSCF